MPALPVAAAETSTSIGFDFMKTRVILVDDHALTLIGMRYLLSAYDDLRIVAQAQDLSLIHIWAWRASSCHSCDGPSDLRMTGCLLYTSRCV